MAGRKKKIKVTYVARGPRGGKIGKTLHFEAATKKELLEKIYKAHAAAIRRSNGR